MSTVDPFVVVIIVFVAIGLIAAAATIRAVLLDGYRRIPDRREVGGWAGDRWDF